MDLEEELSLFQQEEETPLQTAGEAENNEAGEKGNDDLLGLDQTIKLTSRSKVAKIDNERIFNKQKGLNYIIQNHKKLIRVFQKNDKALRKKITKSNLNSKAVRQLKYDNEYDNLSSLLQFYQLWCHGLFPKARFNDCLHLLRSFGSKSSQLKIYRRELLDQELHKLKIAKGIIDLNQEKEDSDIQQRPDEVFEHSEQHQEQEQPIDDDDWSFMNRNQTNGLFVGDDDDLYHSTTNLDATTQLLNEESRNSEVIPSSKSTDNSNESDDPFSDNEIPLNNESLSKEVEYPVQEMNNEEHEEHEEHEDELEVMREMGL